METGRSFNGAMAFAELPALMLNIPFTIPASKAGRNGKGDRLQEQKTAFHPAHVALARVFSSVWLIGPPMSDQLVELVAHLFSPEEASVAVHLPCYLPRSFRTAARRAKLPPDQARELLDAMARRKVILRSRQRYALLPLIPGMFEYLLKDGSDTSWHRRYAQLINALFATGFTVPYSTRPFPAIRNIPVQQAGRRRAAADATHVEDDRLARHMRLGTSARPQSARFSGKECLRALPEDGCLVFGSFARSVEKTGSGRLVSRGEMRSIVRRRWEQGLVFMTANLKPSQPNAVCTCCDCCCHYLEAVNRFGGRAFLAQPHFLARVDEDLCTGCGACAGVCNTHAHTFLEGSHAYEPGRCIGCGLCAEACPAGAATMEENPAYEPPSPGWMPLFLRVIPAAVISALKVAISRMRA